MRDWPDASFFRKNGTFRTSVPYIPVLALYRPLRPVTTGRIQETTIDTYYLRRGSWNLTLDSPYLVPAYSNEIIERLEKKGKRFYINPCGRHLLTIYLVRLCDMELLENASPRPLVRARFEIVAEVVRRYGNNYSAARWFSRTAPRISTLDSSGINQESQALEGM